MNDIVFLMDANAFIAPYQQYYPFDLAKTFWDQLLIHIENGDIAVLDMVKDELLNGNDDDKLKLWIEAATIKNEISHKEKSIVEQYAIVMQYIQECGFYNDTALSSWSQSDVADPWLIATAKTKGMKLVTLEKNFHVLDPKHKTRNVRIPDVAKHFCVNVITLFDMMRELNIHL